MISSRLPSMLLKQSARFALAFLALAVPMAAAHAQAGTTSGGIRGQVIHAQSGVPIPSVEVTATNSATGFMRAGRSGEDGIYSIAFLPPGTYRVVARQIGFAPAGDSAVAVTVGSVTAVNLRLSATATQLETVQITGGSSQISTTRGGVEQTVTEQEIATLPTLGRDFTDFISLSGLVSPLPEVTTGGQFSIAGARPSGTNVQVDGVDANNAFFGENRGGSRIPFAFSLESIKEFQVVTNGFDVEYGNYSGGVVNVVTRGGTNELKGTLYGNYRGKALTSRGFNRDTSGVEIKGDPPRDFLASQYSAAIEGPFIRDKLHFMFSLDGQKRSEPFTPASPATTTDPDEAAKMAEFYEILETVYGIDNAAASYNEFSTKNDVLTLFGRIDWSINDKHRLTVRNNFSNHNNGNETFSGVVRGGLSRAEAFKDKANSLQMELTSALSPKLFNTFRMQYAFEDRPREGNNLKPTLQVSIGSGLSDLSYGGQFIAFDNFLGEKKLQIIDNVTFVAGNHLLKFGTNNIFANIENRFWLNGSGLYEFASLDAFRNGIASRFNRNVRQDGTNPTALFDAQEYSLYAQDQWQVSPKLVATLGLRYDVARYGDTPGRVVDAERAFGITTGHAPIDKNNISPRVSFAYDMRGDAASVIRGGVGLFYGRVPYVMGSNVSITDRPLLVVECRGSIPDGDPTAPPDPLDYRNWSSSGADNPTGCASPTALTGVPEYSFWREDFELPETWKFNIGYERRLTDRTRLSADLIWSSTSKLYTVRNINLRPVQFSIASEGDRQVFVPAGDFNPSASAGSARLLNTDFSNIYMNYNDGASRALSGTFELNHRLSNRISLKGSYTYTKAEDNSSFYCCTSNEGYRTPRVGALGPNVIGDIGDTDAAWGPADFARNHTVVVWGDAELPGGFTVSAIVRMQSGTPWSPEQSGDLNGDGERFNDRLFVYAPENLPVFVSSSASNPDSIVAANRSRYADHLAKFSCIGDHVGKIIPRNTCRQPWFNRVDVSVRKQIQTLSGQSAMIYLDLFNVLNAVNKSWGEYRAVTAAARNLLAPQAYQNGEIKYTVPTTFGDRTALGTNLVLQFSAQVGLRYYF